MRERKEFYKGECKRKDKEYQTLMMLQEEQGGELEKAREEIKEKEQAIANLTTENQKLEEWLAEAAKNEKFLSEELERFKYGVSLADDEPVEVPGEVGEQTPAVSLQPEKPEKLEEQTPAVTVEPETVTSQQLTLDLKPEPVNLEPETETTGKTKLYTPSELAKEINKKNPGANVRDYNVRDWYSNDRFGNPKCSDDHREKMQNLYGFTFRGKDGKKLQFSIP